MTEWREDQLAYDGSSRPMSRELTPRERDILTRILDGWWHKLIEIQAEIEGVRPQFVGGKVNLGKYVEELDVGAFKLKRDRVLDDPRVGWMRMSAEECQLLLDLREVLNPRED